LEEQITTLLATCSHAGFLLSLFFSPEDANKLALNIDKTNIIKFITNNLVQHPLNIGYNGNCIEE
jgi:hypothetical protein